MLEKDGNVTLSEMQSAIKELLSSLSRSIEEIFGSVPTDEATKAKKVWVIFSVVMMLDYAVGIVALAADLRVRAMLPIARSIYEFYITMIYFERHPEYAVAQLNTVEGRRLMRASRGPYESSKEREHVIVRFQDWRRKAAERGLDEYSGNRKFQEMALEIEGETPQDHPTYATRYGIPSMFAHPDAGAVPDVLRPSDRGFKVAWLTESIDPRLQMLVVNDLLICALRFLQDKFAVEPPGLRNLDERHVDLSRRVLREKGAIHAKPDGM